MKNKSEVAEKVSIVIFNDLKVLGDNLDLLKYYKPNKLLNLDSLSKEIENSYLKIIEKTVLKPSRKIILDGGFFHNFQTENIIYTFIS